MPTHLVQTRGFLRIEAELGSNAVRYRSRALFSSHEITVPLHLVPRETTRAFHVNRWHLLICAFLGLGAFYRIADFLTHDGASLQKVFFSVATFAIASIGTWINSARYVGYATAAGALLFFDAHGKNDPGAFLQSIQQARSASNVEPHSRTIGFGPAGIGSAA